MTYEFDMEIRGHKVYTPLFNLERRHIIHTSALDSVMVKTYHDHAEIVSRYDSYNRRNYFSDRYLKKVRSDPELIAIMQELVEIDNERKYGNRHFF